jgi:hypothetical protein
VNLVVQGLPEAMGPKELSRPCQIYKRFIKDFSKITEPLTHLLQKYVAFKLDEKYLVAFRTLKTALVSAPIIQPPDWSQLLYGSLGPLPRWVPELTTRWAPGTTRLVPHGT